MSFTPFFFLFSLLIQDYHTATPKIIGRNSYFKGKSILSEEKKVTKNTELMKYGTHGKGKMPTSRNIQQRAF